MVRDVRPAPPEVRLALRDALIDAACPASHAGRVAEGATYERDEEGDYLCVLGSCVAADGGSPALEDLAEDVVAINAESHDRAARGEVGFEPLWPLAARAPRR
jgi:hypothetical protein